MAVEANDPFGKLSGFPVLTTERLVLREITEADFDWYVEHFSRPEIAEGQGMAAPADLDDARASFARRILEPLAAHDGIRWGICLRGQPAASIAELPLVGSAGVFSVDAEIGACELGYDLDGAFWGRGLISEAVRAILDFVFTELGMNRVEALVMPRNTRSQKVLERLGFTKEGVLREHSLDERGELVDDAVFGLLAKDWRARRPPAAFR